MAIPWSLLAVAALPMATALSRDALLALPTAVAALPAAAADSPIATALAPVAEALTGLE